MKWFECKSLVLVEVAAWRLLSSLVPPIFLLSLSHIVLTHSLSLPSHSLLPLAHCLATLGVGVEGFKDTNKVLALSRVMVSWLPVGMAMGAYDMAARWVGRPYL